MMYFCREETSITMRHGIQVQEGRLNMKMGSLKKDVATTPGASINFINNLIVGYKTVGIQFQSTQSANNLLENNIIINSNGNYIQTYGNNTIQRNNYLKTSVANAKFADTLGNLQSTSPLIDAGYAIPYITKDFFGNPRVMGGTINIGPVEYQGGTQLK